MELTLLDSVVKSMEQLEITGLLLGTLNKQKRSQPTRALRKEEQELIMLSTGSLTISLMIGSSFQTASQSGLSKPV